MTIFGKEKQWNFIEKKRVGSLCNLLNWRLMLKVKLKQKTKNCKTEQRNVVWDTSEFATGSGFYFRVKKKDFSSNHSARLQNKLSLIRHWNLISFTNHCFELAQTIIIKNGEILALSRFEEPGNISSVEFIEILIEIFFLYISVILPKYLSKTVKLCRKKKIWKLCNLLNYRCT